MSKKNLFQIVVAVACFVGAFIVLYNNGVFGSEAVPQVSFIKPGSTPAKGSAGVFGSDQVLPYGKLQASDFDRAFGSRKTGMYKIQYPKLDPNNDVSVPVQDLFVSGSSTLSGIPQQ
ncbi:MAG: hypothetical protein M1400_01025 [Patescibacteria group bacterium]|nr:hypothetical protein [Patescibacteria group bacterium]